MVVPITLIILATASAALVAFGVHPGLGQYESGLSIIILSRRLMWPLIFVSLGLCVALLVMVVSGRRRAWWLVGLAPVLALFVHRFASTSSGPGAVIEAPTFVEASHPAASTIEAGDYVVGVVFRDRAYAFPYRVLYLTPIVCVTDYDKRMLVMWSAYANRATVVELDRELKARDLEVVSTPANSLLAFDRRLGQFICGVTGRRLDRGGGEVIGFGAELKSQKMSWSDWRAKHPNTSLMLSAASLSSLARSPNRPIMPHYGTRAPPVPDAMTPITLIATSPPASVRADDTMAGPLNVTVGSTRLLVTRDDRRSSVVAFDRHVKDDLFLTFAPTMNPKRREITMRDTDTNSEWTGDGRAVEGPLKGTKLRAIDTDDGLYWGVMKHWYPELVLIAPTQASPSGNR